MQTERPLVSVVIPVYNSEDYIEECILSVLNQEYPNIEVIAVDDGSTDRSREIVESLGERVRYIYQENAGSAVARNKGLEEAQGQYVAFNDSDDLWAPNRLEQQVEFLELNPDYGVATGRFTHVGEDFRLNQAAPVDTSKPLSVDPKMSGWVYHTLFKCSWYHIIAGLVRAEVLEKVAFNADFRRGQDFDFWLQLAYHTQIAQLDVNYAYYRKNSQSISHRPHIRNYRAEIMQHALDNFGSQSQSGDGVSQKELNQYFHNTWFEHGYELFLAKFYKPAFNSFWRSLKYKPLRFGSYKFLIRCALQC